MASLHGYEIDCDRELGRVSSARAPLGPIRVRAAATSPLGAHGELRHLVAGHDCAPLHCRARSGSELLVWHADAGSFAIDAEAMAISYCREDAERPEPGLRWADRLGSTAIPLLAAERGDLALHASANLVGERCLVICGVTGRGKSTLSAALATLGHPLMAEDGVVVHGRAGQPTVWPGMAGALVTDEAAEAIGAPAAPVGKNVDQRGRGLREIAIAERPAPVGAIAILAERGGERLELQRLQPAMAHRELLAQALSAGGVGAESFSAAARVAEQAAVARVRMPDRIGDVSAAAGELVTLLAESGRFRSGSTGLRSQAPQPRGER